MCLPCGKSCNKLFDKEKKTYKKLQMPNQIANLTKKEKHIRNLQS